MKKFIMAHWRKIIIGIGIIFLVLDIVNIFLTKNTIINDYAQSGLAPSGDLIDRIPDLVNNISGDTDALTNRVTQETSLTQDIAKGLVVFGICLAVILLFDAITKGSEKKK